jgi:hypothetical protein
MNITSVELQESQFKKKILLVLLPYWTPLIPPQGIAQLKVFLEKHGYLVKTIDVNVETQFKEIYTRYFQNLKKYIPESNWGNFYNIGHDVLRNHMMAWFNRNDETAYNQLVKILIYNTFYCLLPTHQVSQLNRMIDQLYVKLEEYMLGLLEREKPGVLGLTAHLGTLGACMFVSKLTKERYPGIMTVVGGSIFSGELPLASPDFDLFLEKTPYIDKVIVGEGELLFLKLLEGELPWRQRVFTLKDINDSTIDIASIELPDLSDFHLRRYQYNAAFVSKSCPHQCRFCSVVNFFGQYREKTIEQTVHQLDKLYKKHGIQLFFMLDSLLNPTITELSNQLIRKNMSIYMDAYMRVSEETCDPDKVFLWRQGGLYRARFGIESGSQRLLDLMGKNITTEQSRVTLNNFANAGIKTTAYLVIGYPGETEEDFQQTLAFLETSKNQIWEVECNPFYYYYVGQPNAHKWLKKRKLLYPDYAKDMLISQTWILDCEPSREERFKRMFRLVEHCKKLGIPNPYTTKEIFQADVRWEQLHENAVPPLIKFENNGVCIEENRHVKQLSLAKDINRDEGDFIF